MRKTEARRFRFLSNTRKITLSHRQTSVGFPFRFANLPLSGEIAATVTDSTDSTIIGP